jgi:hypothetical protein
VIAEAELLSAQPPSARLAARQLAADHALGLMDAEVAWIERAVRQLAGGGSRKGAGVKLRRVVGE